MARSRSVSLLCPAVLLPSRVLVVSLFLFLGRPRLYDLLLCLGLKGRDTWPTLSSQDPGSTGHSWGQSYREESRQTTQQGFFQLVLEQGTVKGAHASMLRCFFCQMAASRGICWKDCCLPEGPCFPEQGKLLLLAMACI